MVGRLIVVAGILLHPITIKNAESAFFTKKCYFRKVIKDHLITAKSVTDGLDKQYLSDNRFLLNDF